jgi:hypothetical protein
MFFASWILARHSFSNAAPCPERLDLSSSTGLGAGLPPAICPLSQVPSIHLGSTGKPKAWTIGNS